MVTYSAKRAPNDKDRAVAGLLVADRLPQRRQVDVASTYHPPRTLIAVSSGSSRSSHGAAMEVFLAFFRSQTGILVSNCVPELAFIRLVQALRNRSCEGDVVVFARAARRSRSSTGTLMVVIAIAEVYVGMSASDFHRCSAR